MGAVPTFLGPVDGADLGPTLIHEHVFVRNLELEGAVPGLTFDPDEARERAIHDLTALSTSGIRTLVDMTVPGLGRAIPLVAAVAARVPLHLVAATGYYTADVLPLYFQFHGPDRLIDKPDPLVAMFVRDIEEGIAGTPVRAGMIKVMTGPAGWTPDVVRVMSAAATAHATDRRHDHDPLRAGDAQRPGAAGVPPRARRPRGTDRHRSLRRHRGP